MSSSSWGELWRFRELLLTLAVRDLSVRYKQTLVGIAWAVIQPLISVAIMTLIFGRLAGMRAPGDTSYFSLVIAGMLPWQLFANILGTGSQSLVSNANLVSKVYFPRLLLPLSAISVALVDFVVMSFLFFPILIWQGAVPDLKWLLLPLLIVIAGLAALGPALLASAMNVRYRDVRFVIPFLVQTGFFLSPVAYDTSLVREKMGELAAHVYALNPMVTIIDGFRFVLLDGSPPVWSEVLVSLTMIVVVLFFGFSFFRRTEKAFADVI